MSSATLFTITTRQVMLNHDEADAHDAATSGPGGLAALRAAEPQWCARVEALLDVARRQHYY